MKKKVHIAASELVPLCEFLRLNEIFNPKINNELLTKIYKENGTEQKK